MQHKASLSIDVAEIERAVAFYTQALACTFKEKYTDAWQVVSIGSMDIHLQQKAAGTLAAADQRRNYARHWTPVHLDFSVADIRPVCAAVVAQGGIVEDQQFSEQADIAHCADPFGNGFCVIRE